MNIINKKSPFVFTIDNLFHKYDCYCCPYCTNLPEILNYNEGNGMVKFICKKHGENNMDIQDYLENMQKFITVSEVNTKNKCNEHKNENYSNFCLTCQENLCQKCLKKHENHINYNIESLRPNNNEILLIKNKISIYLQEKTQLMKNLKILEDKITFFDTLLNTLEKQKPNFYLNINVKHLLYGEKINLDEIVKDFKQKSGLINSEAKKEEFEDFIKNNFLEVTKGKDKLSLVDKNLGDILITDLMNGLENSSIFKILKFGGKINNPKELISIKDIKILNLRGNKLTNIDFLLNKNFASLEILSLNDNEIESIDNLKQINLSLLKELYLSKNKIDNIDVLEYMNTPSLRVLWLSNNNITNIDVLAKVKFPQLLKLCLSKNKIVDISVFSKNKAKFPQLYELYLNDNEFDLKTFEKIIGLLFSKVKQFYY